MSYRSLSNKKIHFRENLKKNSSHSTKKSTNSERFQNNLPNVFRFLRREGGGTERGREMEKCGASKWAGYKGSDFGHEKRRGRNRKGDGT